MALEKLGEALADGDDSVKAVEMWSRAAKLAAESGEADASEMLRNRIAALDPVAAEALDLTVADAPAPAPAPESAPESEPEFDTGERLIADDLLDDASDDLSTPDDLRAASSDEGSASLDDTDLPELDLAEVSIRGTEIEIEIDDASFTQEPSDEELPTAPEAELTADDPASIADADMDEISIDDLPNASESAENGEVDVADEDVDSEALTVTGAGGGDVSPEKITEDLEEADFYMEQGLLDEAEAVYTRILSISPDHPHAMLRLGELASQRGDPSGSVDVATDPASAVADSTDSVSEEPAAKDIGADLANWQEGSPDDEAQETDEQPGGIDSGALVPEGSSDPTATEVGSVDTTDALDGVEEGRAREESVAAESNLAADLGLEDSMDFGPGSEVDDGDSTSADEQDDAGEEPDVSVEPDISAEPDVSVEPDESEGPKPVETIEGSVEVASEAPDGEREPADGGDNFGFDLAAELSQSFDQDPGASSSGTKSAPGRGDTSEDGFASLFAEFKKGVSETLTEGDHQAHYDLGIAYREMGLLNDAVTEFQLAMDASERRVGCLHLMGMCAHDMGEPEQAIGHFTEALGSGDNSDETVLALKLDLGKSHEAVGDIASARRAYEEIQAVDSDFANVAARLDELEKSENAESQKDDSQGTEEYETFQEFLGDLDEPDAAEPEAPAESAGDTEEAPVWETFDDVVAEIEATDNADSSSEEPEAAASADSDSVAKDSEPAGETEKTPKRRKKKISFI
jgi:tetratricopeptide (TPR) repeat protein